MQDTADKENMTLEQGFERLEQITRKMEAGDLPLEEMYTLYKEGLSIAKACGEKIDTVEKNIQILDASGTCTDFEGAGKQPAEEIPVDFSEFTDEIFGKTEKKPAEKTFLDDDLFLKAGVPEPDDGLPWH